MQLNASTCYAMQIVLYLARSKRIVSSTELSENLNISQRYILQFTGKLRDGGIICTHAGVGGGFTLNMDTADISAYDVITLMEGDLSIPACMERLSCSGEPCVKTNLLDTLSHMNEYIESYLRTITFDKLTILDTNGRLPETLDMVRVHIDEIKQQA